MAMGSTAGETAHPSSQRPTAAKRASRTSAAKSRGKKAAARSKGKKATGKKTSTAAPKIWKKSEVKALLWAAFDRGVKSVDPKGMKLTVTARSFPLSFYGAKFDANFLKWDAKLHAQSERCAERAGKKAARKAKRAGRTTIGKPQIQEASQEVQAAIHRVRAKSPGSGPIGGIC
jgi:hypothetical protein